MVDEYAERIREIGRVARVRAKTAPAYIKFLGNYITDPKQASVIPSLILFYVLCAIDGAYNIFAAIVPTQTLEGVLSHKQYNIFIWITFIAPLLTLVGMTLRGKWAYTGAIMQLMGDIGVCGVLTTFIVAVMYTNWWGQGNFGTAWILASAIGSAIFIARDIRRIADSERWIDRK